jgi:DNA segregation ATPase FtsK/SpoIIIE-like protein
MKIHIELDVPEKTGVRLARLIRELAVTCSMRDKVTVFADDANNAFAFEDDSELYRQAVECVTQDNKPTISHIQRRLAIGYNKAAGFMKQMEHAGIVSAPDADNKRHIINSNF